LEVCTAGSPFPENWVVHVGINRSVAAGHGYDFVRMAKERSAAERQQARVARRMAALAARAGMSPSGRALDRLRIATWNVNSLRRRAGAVESFVDGVYPDVLCLQETKVKGVPEQLAASLRDTGYRFVHVGHGAYNGVAIVARHPITEVARAGSFGDESLDRDARIVACRVATPEELLVVSVYVPHGRSVGHWHYDFKLAFLDALTARVRRWLRDDTLIVVAGDVNVAATDSDVFHPDAFVGLTHVTPEERTALADFYAAGLVDVDAARWGAHARRFTWWSHGIGYSRNLGMRLDHIAVDGALAERLDTTWIDHTMRGAPEASDHAALIADFHRDHRHGEPE
jgi:exodeoxyribonuclease III